MQPRAEAADGTNYNIYVDDLVAEFHIRYGGYGGLAYHHIADNYIALSSRFVPCGVWEAVYIIERGHGASSPVSAPSSSASWSRCARRSTSTCAGL
ncbi:Tn3 family transposase [Nonomuraea angiospora]